MSKENQNQDKLEISELILKAYDAQENVADRMKQESAVYQIERAIESTRKAHVGMGNDPVTQEILSNTMDQLNERVNALNLDIVKNYKTDQELEMANKGIVADYLELSAKNKTLDVAIDFTSTYPGGTETFKKIIEEMNNNGAGIEVLFEKFKGRNPQDNFGGYDSRFVIAMPSASYAEFNTKIHEDQPDSRYDVIGARNEIYFMPHLMAKPTLDFMKKKVAEHISNDNSGLKRFNKELGIGYVDLTGSNYHSQDKIERAIGEYVSNIRKLERHSTEEYDVAKPRNIATSGYTYSKDSEWEGMIVSPLKEANRVMAEAAKPKVEPEVKQKEENKKKKRSRNRLS